VNALPSTATFERAFGRLEGKVDLALTLLKKQGEGHDLLEARTLKIERRQYVTAGGAAALGSLLTAAIALMGVLPR